MTDTETIAPLLSQRLKMETQAAHQALDSGIMAAQPFASRERYTLFLWVQHQFHRDLRDVYSDERIAALLPDLGARCRLADIEADLADLGQAQPGQEGSPLAEDLATRLGWLYVAEGSNLGAAFLLKAAAKLGLHERFGARHLSGAPEGRGLRWKRFQKALDEADLSASERARVIAGATAAFRRVQQLADARFGGS